MGIKKDFQTLRQAIKNYMLRPCDELADAIAIQKEICCTKYGKTETDKQVHTIFQSLS